MRPLHHSYPIFFLSMAHRERLAAAPPSYVFSRRYCTRLGLKGTSAINELTMLGVEENPPLLGVGLCNRIVRGIKASLVAGHNLEIEC